MSKPKKPKKPWPALKTDDEVDEFVASADLSEYEWGPLERVHHEFENKSERVTIRIPRGQLMHIKEEASKRGMKYQRFMRELMSRGFQTLS